MSAAAQPPQLMSADEFLRLHVDDSGVELVDGQIVELPMPGAKHGEVCMAVSIIIGGYVKTNRLGRAMGNDTFIRTKTTAVRGADVLYVSYATLPADRPTPTGVITPPVELAVEVRSPSNTIAELTDKATEYIKAGVKVVVVFDPNTESAAVFRPEELPQRFHNGDVLTLPDILPGFEVPVKAFFE